MTDTSAPMTAMHESPPVTSRTVSALRNQAALAPTFAEQQQLIVAAEQAQGEVLRAQAAERETDLLASVTSQVIPGRVHELHTASTDWLGDVDTGMDLRTAQSHMIAKGTVWYQGLATEVRADASEFVEQARGFARHTAGSFGEHADASEHAFFEHVAALRDREIQGGIFAEATPMPSQPGDPAGTFTSGGGQDWLPGDATSSNRAPQLQELAAPESQDLTPTNDPGVGAGDPDPAVAQQARTAAAHTSVSAADLESFPRCAKCDNPVSPIEMARTATNEPVHGSCVGITGSSKEGQHMQTAPCPTCGTGRVAVRQAPQPSISDLVRTANSGLPQIDQIVDPSDTQAAATPLPQEVAFPWTIAPGQVENTIGEAEQQIAEREQRKGASRSNLANQAANQAYRMAYQAVVRQEMSRLGEVHFDPQRRHAILHQHAARLGQQAGHEAARIVMQAGQDDSGWMGDMGQGGVGPGQQDGGNPPSTNLGEPDPVYGYGGDNPNQPLKPYGADEAEDYTNNPGQNWQPGQPLQYDMGGRMTSTETPAGGGAVPKISSADREANDPELQKALAFVRNRRQFLAQRGR